LTLTRMCKLVACIVCLAAGNASATPEASSQARDGWDYSLSANKLAALCDATIAAAGKAFTALEKDTSPATVQSVYGPYNAMQITLQAIEYVWYMKAVHPDTGVQAAAEQCVTAYTDFLVAVNLSPAFYQRVAAIDLESASESERFMINKKLKAFRQAGVDRDRATRDKARALTRTITDLGSTFEKAIRVDNRFVDTTPLQLAGLPQDFLDRHAPDDNGIIRISTDYPNYIPILQYATDDKLRYELFKAAKNVATPANSKTLTELIARRHELAILLGYDSHAAMAMDGLMVGAPDTAQDFLTQVGAAVQKPAGSELDTLLARLRVAEPQAKQVQAWQVDWLENLVRQEDFALNSQEIRTYFQFAKVQAGIFQLTEDMFGVQIVPWHTPTWHQDVTAWEIREDGKPLGRFYLDMHPRDNKYGHAAHWVLRTGLKDGQLPLSGMATNFSRGLMEHSQIESFLHEFGHLLHNMFSGTQQWMDISGMSMERDFVEAPSQMLEQWAWNYDTLREFAVNEKGEPIPPELVAKMNAARHFGEAVNVAAQVFYANLALAYYNTDPDSFQLLPMLQTLQAQYAPFPYVEGTHFYNNFRHLNGYSSNYYTYQWSQALSLDMFSRFQSNGLRDAATARAYREKVLAPAGSKPAAQLVEDFLGRPFSPATYTRYLQQLN
jgi:Zn-dependent oligopeptidase